MSEVLSMPRLDDEELMENEEAIAERRDQYVEYLYEKMVGAFSFEDWHELTFGKSLDEDQLELFTGPDSRDIIETFTDHVHHVIKDINR